MNFPAASSGVSNRKFSDLIVASDGVSDPSFAITQIEIAQISLDFQLKKGMV